MIVCLGTTPTVQRTMTFAKLTIDDVNRATSVRQFASGKSVNAARVLHTLGEAVIATGIVGGDSGRFMQADLSSAGIAHEFVDGQVPTRLCLTLVDEAGRTATELIEESSPPGAAAFRMLLEKLSGLLSRDASVLVLSGTLAPGAGDDFYARCVRLAREAGTRSIVDARGEPMRLAMETGCDVAKLNRAELSATTGVRIESEADLRDAMGRAIRAGARWAVVTAGADVSWITDGARSWTIRPPSVEVVNPIGSGDSFAAGLACGLARGQDVAEACRLGTACAAANAMTRDAGHVDPADVARLHRAIVLEPV